MGGEKRKGRFFPVENEPTYYEDIPHLMMKLYDQLFHLKEVITIFNTLPKSKSVKVKDWCKFIIQRREEYNNNNLHTIQDQVTRQLCESLSAQNTTITTFYVLPQRDLLQKNYSRL